MPGLFRLLLFLGIGYLIVSGIRRLFLPAAASSQKQAVHTTDLDSVPLVQDPQCGRFVPQNEAIVVSRRGRSQTLYFCSEECRAAYKAA
jgi:YHS domain-containing protein